MVRAATLLGGTRASPACGLRDWRGGTCFAYTPRMAVDSTLVLTALVKRYGDTQAVAGIDLTIPSGSYCCLLGPSGCGKTSTLRMIAGHELASEGRVLLGGKDITGSSPADRGTAMMFQSYALFPHLSVLDNVAFSWKMRGKSVAERHARAKELLQLVAMSPTSRGCRANSPAASSSAWRWRAR